MNVAFTIVARNYLSFAVTLADSFKRHADGTDFIIFLTEKKTDIPLHISNGYKIEELNKTIVPDLESMAFKYNITEFSTAVKPFIFSYLFEIKGYDRIIYFDPDIKLYHSPALIYEWLDTKFCILTPHIVTPQAVYSGSINDTEFLYAGIYNLGFIGIKNCGDAFQFLEWWKNRLSRYCFGDRFESLHVDQKWIDFVPSFYRDRVMIPEHPGLNISYWNIHERQIVIDEYSVSVQNIYNNNGIFPIIFIHFSGVDPMNIYKNKQCKSLNIKKYPEWEGLILSYAKEVLEKDYDQLKCIKYEYSSFENGGTILHIHRRIYRRLLDLDLIPISENPFSTTSGSFYSKLKKNGLLPKADKTVVSGPVVDSPTNINRLRRTLFLLRCIKRVLGIRKYQMFIRFFQKILSAENQIFLLKENEKTLIQYYREKNLN